MRRSGQAAAILDRLSTQHPGADTELVFHSPFELLIATILSAQTTDQRVNQVMPALVARFPDARSLAAAPIAEVERIIQPTGFFRQKSRTITAAAAEIVERFGAEVPGAMDSLVQIPGVGRKTANVVLGHAFRVPGFAVDRHVLRVANRLGIATSVDPEEVERQITSVLPPQQWTVASDTLILHGRRVCKPRPLCEGCEAADLCAFRISARSVSASRRRTGLTPVKRASTAAASPRKRKAPGRSSRSRSR